jgi:hypothetical protein
LPDGSACTVEVAEMRPPLDFSLLVHALTVHEPSRKKAVVEKRDSGTGEGSPSISAGPRKGRKGAPTQGGTLRY